MNKENWELKKLGDITIVNMGQSPTSNSYNSNKDGLPFFQGNADFGKIYPSIRLYTNNPIKIADKKDVLVSVRAPIGAVNIANQKCCIGRGLASIKAIENLSLPKFIYYLLIGSNDKLNRQGTGSTFKAISKKTLSTLEVPNYPLSVQSAIVAELDTLHRLKELQEQQLEKYDKLAQSTFHAMFGDPIKNEKGWKVKKLGELGNIVTGSTPATSNSENYKSNDYCFVKPSDFSNSITYIYDSEYYISEYAYDKSRKVPANSVLVTCIGSIGNVAINRVECTTNQQINSIIPNNNISSIFLAYSIFLKRDFLKFIANAPVVPIINKNRFSLIDLSLPPLSLQNEFAKRIEKIEAQKDLVKQSIAETEQLISYTMDKYFG